MIVFWGARMRFLGETSFAEVSPNPFKNLIGSFTATVALKNKILCFFIKKKHRGQLALPRVSFFMGIVWICFLGIDRLPFYRI